jgi:hypothetical protein
MTTGRRVAVTADVDGIGVTIARPSPIVRQRL